MRLAEFDYELPLDLIAQEPAAKRDLSRLLMVDRATHRWHDSEFRRLPDYLNRNDLLVVNNTRVFPARLIGQRHPTGGAVELLLVREVAPSTWETLARPGQRLKLGAQ